MAVTAPLSFVHGGNNAVKQVEIVKNTVAAKKPVRIGDVVELDDSEAQFLIYRGKAKAYTPPAKSEPEPEETPAPRRRARHQHEDSK